MTPPEAQSLDIVRICHTLASYRYNFQNELTLQDGIALVLEKSAILFKREAMLSAKSRPDFLLGPVAIEVKIKGSVAEFLRQAHRYLMHDEVSALIVVGTPKWLPLVPSELAGKPVYSVRLLSSLL